MSNTMLYGLLAALFVLVAIQYWRTRQVEENFGKDSYAPSTLLDSSEVRVFKQLSATYPDRIVVAKLPLAQLLDVDRAVDRRRARDRLDGMLAQFAVCGIDGSVQLVFEMETPAARKSATFTRQLKRKYALLKSAGIPMVRVKSGEIPAPQEFRKQLDFAIEQRGTARPRPATAEGGATSLPMSVTDVMRPGQMGAAPGEKKVIH
jgi:hypothetical protein